MEEFNTKIEKLLNIYSIPLQEDWNIHGDKKSYNTYKYWQNIGILNAKELDTLFIKKCLDKNPVLINFFKSIDYHFNPKYYDQGLVADVGCGFGFITFWLILSGAKKVYSTGDPLRISFIERLYRSAVDKKLIPNDIP